MNIFKNWIKLTDEKNRPIRKRDIVGISDVEISVPEGGVDYGEYRGKLIVYRARLSDKEKKEVIDKPNKNEVWLK